MREYLRPGFAVPYAAAAAIFVVAVISFGWAGFWLGLAVLALVKVARWGIPLIKLSYQQEPPAAEAKAPVVANDASGEPVEASK